MTADEQIKSDPTIRVMVDWLRTIDNDVKRLHLRRATIAGELDKRVAEIKAQQYTQTQEASS